MTIIIISVAYHESSKFIFSEQTNKHLKELTLSSTDEMYCVPKLLYILFCNLIYDITEKRVKNIKIFTFPKLSIFFFFKLFCSIFLNLSWVLVKWTFFLFKLSKTSLVSVLFQLVPKNCDSKRQLIFYEGKWRFNGLQWTFSFGEQILLRFGFTIERVKAARDLTSQLDDKYENNENYNSFTFSKGKAFVFDKKLHYGIHDVSSDREIVMSMTSYPKNVDILSDHKHGKSVILTKIEHFKNDSQHSMGIKNEAYEQLTSFGKIPSLRFHNATLECSKFEPTNFNNQFNDGLHVFKKNFQIVEKSDLYALLTPAERQELKQLYLNSLDAFDKSQLLLPFINYEDR